MKTVSESECLSCRRMAICVYLISGRHFTSAIADQQTGKCMKRNRDHGIIMKGVLYDADYEDQMFGLRK